MTTTIGYTLNPNSLKTVSEINALFTAIASVLNDNKMKQDGVLLAGQWAANYQRVMNLKPGVDASDALTVGQVRALIGAATNPTAVPLPPQPDALAPVPVDPPFSTAYYTHQPSVEPFIAKYSTGGVLPLGGDFVDKSLDNLAVGLQIALQVLPDRFGASFMQVPVDMNSQRIRNISGSTMSGGLVTRQQISAYL